VTKVLCKDSLLLTVEDFDLGQHVGEHGGLRRRLALLKGKQDQVSERRAHVVETALRNSVTSF
jgi:hypothetical protein